MASSSQKSNMSKISMVLLGIDVFLWIQLIAVLGYDLYFFLSRYWKNYFLAQILNYGGFANLLTMTMLGIESYGTYKKNTWAIIGSLVIRCHRIIMFVGFSLELPEDEYFRWIWIQDTSLLGAALYYDFFIIIGWDILKIILTATITLIIQRRKLPKEQINGVGSIIIREPSIIIDDSMY